MIYRLSRLVISLLVIAILLVAPLANPVLANADPPTEAVKSAIIGQRGWYDPSGGACTSGGTVTLANADVFVLGDSYAVGLEQHGLVDSLKAKAYDNITIDASTGRSIDGAGQDRDKTSGTEALAKDSATLASVATIVIVLGTNQPTTYSSLIPDFAKKLRAINGSARIYWVNTGNLDTPSTAQAKANAAINENSSTYNYSVIDWNGLFAQNPTKYFNPGGLHPNTTGWEAMRDLIVGKLGAPGATSSASNNSNTVPYTLPATHGRTGSEEPIDAEGRVPSTNHPVSFPKYAALGQAYRDYYITMRWTFSSWSWDGHNKIVDNEQLKAFTSGDKPLLLLVTNKRTGKSIIAAALETGPGPSVGSTWRKQHNNSSSPAPPWWQDFLTTPPTQYDGIVSGLPPVARDALDVKVDYDPAGNGDDLIYQWAPDQNATPGPTNATGTSSSSCSGATAGQNGWEISGDNAMTVYEQYDPAYKNHQYGATATDTIAKCGCGPTSMAMAIATLTGDKSVTPITTADYYATHGGIAEGCGSKWNWDTFSDKWPIKISDLGSDLQSAISVVKSGGFVLVSYTGGPFTSNVPDKDGNLPGHFFLMRAVTDDGKILIANPLGHYAGSVWANQNTNPWDPIYFSTQTNPSNGYVKHFWGITKQ